MKTKFYTLFSILLFPFVLDAQDSLLRRFPVHISFVYPVGMHGLQSTRFEYDLSFNMLTGFTGAINGFQLGGILNRNLGTMNGAQIAGIGNHNGGNIDGLQVGGIYSFAKNVDGLQLNGIYSKASEAEGAQISGIVNFSQNAEVSIAGIMNYNQGEQNGIQLAGILNKTKKLNGIQIGFINMVDTIEKGMPIGFISLVKKGFYDEWEFSVADYANLSISYKLGVKELYSIYTVGMNLVEEQLWVTGFGFGHLHEINPKLWFQPELIWYHYLPMDFSGLRDTEISHFKLGFLKEIHDRMAISVAPSIYMGWKQRKNADQDFGYEQSLINELVNVDRNRKERFEFGFGISFGIHFM